MTGQLHEWVVPDELAGERVDRIVASLAGISRGAARKVADSGAVTSRGEVLKAACRLQAGVGIEATIPPPEPRSLQAVPVEFGVAYEDALVIVVDKPPGLVVHPGAGHRNDTLANGLVERFPDLAPLDEAHRWGIVHRLDRDTSGVLIVARSAAAHRSLQAALQARRVVRTYLCLAMGSFSAATGTIEAPIGRDPAQPTRMAVRREGRFARTHYRRLAGWSVPDVTLLEVTLDTGRTHQIRVHMASIGCPLVGDPVYGRPGAPAADPGRVWLHAAAISFPHPASGRVVDAKSPLPLDLRESLERLGPPTDGELP